MARKKSLSKRIFQSRAMHFVLSVIASLLMRFIYLTSRVEKRFHDEALPYLRGEKPAIFCFWHGRMIMHPFVKPPGRTMSVLISHHNDGALITETMLRFGIGSVRGSKKLGSTKALLDLFKVTEAGGNISITPDGPRGPFQKAAGGAAYVAAKTGYPLLPITFSATRHWRFKSWDKFMLPKPFSRILFVAGAPLTVSGEEEETGSAATLTLETNLAGVTAEADQALHNSSPLAGEVRWGGMPHIHCPTKSPPTLALPRKGGGNITRFCYSATGILLYPLIRLWLARRVRRGKEDSARLAERFGHASTARPTGTLIWLHAASVGEAQSVLTLVRALLAQNDAIHFLITTGTVTSAALVAQQNLPRTIHQFIPIDTYPAVKRFLTHWHPDLALWVESEFWPQLLWQAHARSIPMLLINARMSARSFAGWKKWPRTIRSLLDGFSAIYVGSMEDAQHLGALGAKNLHDVGNLKYDASPLPVNEALLQELNTQCLTRSVWVAASTHANEEQMIAEVHAQLLQQFPELLCILVPRHATRGDTIAEDLRQRGTHLAQRSKGERITPDTQLYLADTMGELGNFYALSDIVFIGGSLVAVGGHNPLEPARLSAALITGPHIHNFSAIMQHLLQNDALRIVQQKTDLATTVAELLRDETARRAMAANALSIVQSARGASEQIVQHSLTLLAEKRA